MDFENLAGSLNEVGRVLTPGGSFTFVMAHPAFLVPEGERTTVGAERPAFAVTAYFGERHWRSSNPEGVRRAGYFHRPLATYLTLLSQAGFDLEEAFEPRGSDTLVEAQPIYGEVPMFFVARYRKRSAS